MGYSSIKVISEQAGDTLIDDRIFGNKATALIIEDASKNKGFKTVANAVVFTDGTLPFYIGCEVTIFFETP